MRHIVLRSSVNEEGTLTLEALASLTQRSSGTIAEWVDFKEAQTNCIDPAKCGLLSFEDEDELKENLELWGIAAENVASIGVEAG